jgi:hypothetical protein
MQLTLEEKKTIARFILKENKVTTLHEAKGNNNLLKELKLNIQFYSGLKEHLYKNKSLQEAITTGIGWIDNVIGFFGSVKDLLTGTSLGKWIVNKLKAAAERLFPKLSQNPNDVTDKIANFFKKISKLLGASGIAYIIAAWKQKSLKPSKEAIDAAMPVAEKINKIILGILIAVAIAKLVMFLAPLGPAILKSFAAFAKVGGGTQGVLQAGMVAGPLMGKILAAAGLKGIAAAGFNVTGLIQKIQHLGHSEAGHEAEKFADQELAKAPAEIDAAVK